MKHNTTFFKYLIVDKAGNITVEKINDTSKLSLYNFFNKIMNNDGEIAKTPVENVYVMYDNVYGWDKDFTDIKDDLNQRISKLISANVYNSCIIFELNPKNKDKDLILEKVLEYENDSFKSISDEKINFLEELLAN